MSAAPFTPGPWRADATVAMHDRPDLPCVIDQYRLVVAQCWDDGHTEDECGANARLIAAAPDLYEALEAVNLSAVSLDPETFNHGFLVEWPAIQKVMAALAKARGEA